jgi:hypothetical protein
MTDDGKWLAVAPDGRYDSSDDGIVPWAYWSGFEKGSRIAIGATKSKYYRPGLLPTILSGSDKSAGAPLTYGDIIELIGSLALYEARTDQ